MINFLFYILFIFNKCSRDINIYENYNNTIYNNILANHSLNQNNNSKIRKNVILGLIEGYSLNIILPFFKSFIKADFKNCDIVIFIRKISAEIKNYLQGIGVLIYEIPEKYSKISVINVRWKMYIDFLNENINKYKLVFSTDIRDTFFQADVFKYYENHGPFLGVAVEDGTLKQEFNKKWIINYVGEEKYSIIKKERIICVGSIWGTYDKFLEFSNVFWERLKSSPGSIEQGIANYMLYYEKIFNDCLLKSDNYGPVMTIGLTNPSNLILDNDDNILNYDGEIAAVIHQYDRKEDLVIKVYKKYCPELSDFIKSKEKMFYEKNKKNFILNNTNNEIIINDQTNQIKQLNKRFNDILYIFILLEIVTILVFVKIIMLINSGKKNYFLYKLKTKFKYNKNI